MTDTSTETSPNTTASPERSPWRPPLELLAPAGNWECAKAAVANGADAIYFGLQRFNARLRADNFTEADLPELMSWLHQHGVRGFVAMNTLIFTSELDDAAAQLRLLEAAGVDAIIVQDIGLVRMAQALTPKLEIHASTQMTLTSPEGLDFVQNSLGLDRAVLARELSLRELKKFQATDAGAVPLEVFVHGALCVAYSGQCLTSESLGQRSANRGECAQACRMPYELVVDGQRQDLGDKRYLLSPQDLAAHQEIPDLIKLGVTSFKIEGRLKNPEYVAAVTRVYRKAIDAAAAAQDRSPVTEEDRYALEMAFSRGQYSGWMHGVNHQELVHARFGKKRGAYLGTVAKVGPDYVELRLVSPVAAGDGLVFENPSDTNSEMGGRIFSLERGRIYFERRSNVDLRRVRAGIRVYKTDDPKLNAELRHTWSQAGNSPGRISVRLSVHGAAGSPLRVVATAHGPAGEKSITLHSSMPLETAQTRPLIPGVVAHQMSRLGGTPFYLADLHCSFSGQVMLPISELNRLRRQMVERLAPLAQSPIRQEPPRVATWRELLPQAATSTANSPTLSVLARSMEQIEAALEANIGELYVDFEDIRRFTDAVTLVRESKAQTAIILATPRIQKAGEEGFFKLIERAEPDGVLIRNLGAISYFKEMTHLRKIGDFSLNVANPLTADFFLQHGMERLTISYDLNIQQVLDLLKQGPVERLELTLHQHMPMFHMEHCVFCAFMSQGTDYTNCGRPCDRHAVQLRDRVGMLHPLLADVGCRNTLYHGKAQTGARFYNTLHQAGLRRFRIEMLREDKATTSTAIQAYQRLLTEKDEGEQLWQKLNATSQLGVTEGTLGTD